MGLKIERYRGGRHFAVYDPTGALICLTVYKKGGVELARRFTEVENMIHNKGPLFIGYARLEEWIEYIDKREPVLAMPLVEPGTEQGGLRTDRLMVVTQQVDTSGHVHYCRLRAADITRCYGEPFNSDASDREAAWHSLWELVQEELLQHGCTVRNACVAHPRQYLFLEGRASGITFDRTAKRYIRRTEGRMEGGEHAVSPTRS